MSSHAATVCVFGADGGGTKTIGILADGDGRPLARRQVGAANPNVVGVERSAETLADLIVDCCRDAATAPGALRAAVFGLAGAGAGEIRDRLLVALGDALRKRGEAVPPIGLESDARIALEGAFDGGSGAIVIAGTGSIVLGKTHDGAISRAGGWGRTLGDEGSGYYLGREAVRLLTQTLDGRIRWGRLATALSERQGWTTREKVIVAIYQDGFEIPSLAPLVIETAEEGDQDSVAILNRGAEELAAQVGVLARLVEGNDRVAISFVGGLIDHDSIYSKILSAEICRRVPRADIRAPLHPPVDGAVLLALHNARIMRS